jgi:TPR repeat protein
MALLGRMHEFGDGLPADIDKAVALYRQAAAAGDAVGQECLASCCLAATGTAYDPAEAYHWLDQALQQGSSHARFLIGLMFLRGLGVEPDAGEASGWFLAAAEAGHGRAQCELGRLYLNGDGLAGNAGEAIRWLQCAVDAGVDEAGPLLERARMCRSVESSATTPVGTAQQESTGVIIHPFPTAAVASKEELSR